MKPLYDHEKLDRLMEEAGVDLVLAHTPHNLRYLTGGYYFHFRERVAAIGPSQYLPFVGIPQEKPRKRLSGGLARRGGSAQRGGHLDTGRHLHEGAGHRRCCGNGRRGHQEARPR